MKMSKTITPETQNFENLKIIYEQLSQDSNVQAVEDSGIVLGLDQKNPFLVAIFERPEKPSETKGRRRVSEALDERTQELDMALKQYSIIPHSHPYSFLIKSGKRVKKYVQTPRLFGDWVYDVERGLFIGRNLMQVDERVKRAAEKAGVELEDFRYVVVNHSLINNLKAFLGNLEPPFQDLETTSRLLTLEEYERYREWAGLYDNKRLLSGIQIVGGLWSTMNNFEELIYRNNSRDSYSLITSFPQEIVRENVRLDDYKPDYIPSIYGEEPEIREVVELNLRKKPF